MLNVEEQLFDRVHDAQFIFRQLLDAMSRPGKMNSIGSSSMKIGLSSGAEQVVASFALTLLDGEVSFFVNMANHLVIQEFIRKNTFSRLTEVEDADYLFLDGKINDEEIAHLIQKVKKGTLIQPDFSSTLFILVDGFSVEPAEDRLTLRGPGIEEKLICYVNGISSIWWEEREKANLEYPLGIDIILFTEAGEFLALPRTTIIKRGV